MERNKFIAQNFQLLKYTARKVLVKLPRCVTYEDLVGFGAFGLIEAVETFDSTRYSKFSDYAITLIRRSIYDELRKLDFLPQSVRIRLREIKAKTEYLEELLGRHPSDEEVANELDIPLKKYNLLKFYLASSEEPDELSEDSVSKAFQPEEAFQVKERRSEIVKAVKILPDKERKIVILYYYRNKSQDEIGALLNMSGSNVSILTKKALSKLEEELEFSF